MEEFLTLDLRKLLSEYSIERRVTGYFVSGSRRGYIPAKSAPRANSYLMSRDLRGAPSVSQFHNFVGGGDGAGTVGDDEDGLVLCQL